MSNSIQHSERELKESFVRCEKQIELLKQIMRLEAEDPRYQQGPNWQQRMGYYELQLRQERATQAKLLSAIIRKQAREEESDDADAGIPGAAQEPPAPDEDILKRIHAEESAALEEANIIESFLSYFNREFYGDGEFSASGIRHGWGGQGRKYYDEILSQMFKAAVAYKKRAIELIEELPRNERIAELPSLLHICIEQIDLLDKALNSLEPSEKITRSESAPYAPSYYDYENESRPDNP